MTCSERERERERERDCIKNAINSMVQGLILKFYVPKIGVLYLFALGIFPVK
jgi:hypothetical protein